MKKIFLLLGLIITTISVTACTEKEEVKTANVEFFGMSNIQLELVATNVDVDVFRGISVYEGATNVTNSVLATIVDREGKSENAIRQNIENRYTVTYTYIDSLGSKHSQSRVIQVGTMLGLYDYDKVKTTYEMIWNDEFNGTELDLTKWKFDIGTGAAYNLWGWGNNELQYYTNSTNNIFVKDGALTIRAIKEDKRDTNGYTANYTSAKITTQNNLNFTYGYTEAKIKVPAGKGTWAAYWMMPDKSVYGDWPNSGEIDIMEHVGYDYGNIHANTHTKAHNGGGHNGLGGSKVLTDITSEYITYGVEWLPDKLNFYINGECYYTYIPANWSGTGGITRAVWPFDQDFYLILNLAIGGQWGGSQGIDPDITPADMIVDYVRVYQSSEIKEFYN